MEACRVSIEYIISIETARYNESIISIKQNAVLCQFRLHLSACVCSLIPCDMYSISKATCMYFKIDSIEVEKTNKLVI